MVTIFYCPVVREAGIHNDTAGFVFGRSPARGFVVVCINVAVPVGKGGFFEVICRMEGVGEGKGLRLVVFVYRIVYVLLTIEKRANQTVVRIDSAHELGNQVCDGNRV